MGAYMSSKRLNKRKNDSSDFTVIKGVTYKVANTKKERENSFKLVYDSYIESGLTSENLKGIRLISHHLNPMTDIFIAKKDEEILYTVTLITDDSFGIPMEEVFKEEVRYVREKYSCFAEMSCLAGIKNKMDGFKIYLNLMSLVVQFSNKNDIECLLLAVHPRHAKFYSRFFGCVPIADTKNYSAVCDSPATPCIHDFSRYYNCQFPTELPYQMYNNMYEHIFCDWELIRQPMSQEERNYFSQFLTKDKEFTLFSSE
jgi:hypothetical protein